MKSTKNLQQLTVIALFFLFAIASPLQADKTVTERIKKPLDQSIVTRQKSQKELDKWEQERLKLVAEFNRLTSKNETLTANYTALQKQVASQKRLNASLVERERESRKIAEEIVPFLEALHIRVADFISSDTPFLAEERVQRVSRLRKVLDDMEVGAAEKFRKYMETLFIEADYGNTIEVYQEKIVIGEEEILGDIFRLGRLSLFFLSLDHTLPASYNVAEEKWVLLDTDYAEAIHAAIEMGSKRRPAELLCLPLGKLAGKSE